MSSAPPDKPVPAAVSEALPPPPALADTAAKLRPVLNLIGESLGAGAETQRAQAARSVSVLIRYLAASRQKTSDTKGASEPPPGSDEAKAVLEELRLRRS